MIRLRSNVDIWNLKVSTLLELYGIFFLVSLCQTWDLLSDALQPFATYLY